MYEKMFSALDPSGSATCGSRKNEDMFNNTNMSFGKEIENIQKQFNAEMQTRISELESLLKQKEEDMDVIVLKNKQQLSDLQFELK